MPDLHPDTNFKAQGHEIVQNFFSGSIKRLAIAMTHITHVSPWKGTLKFQGHESGTYVSTTEEWSQIFIRLALWPFFPDRHGGSWHWPWDVFERHVVCFIPLPAVSLIGVPHMTHWLSLTLRWPCSVKVIKWLKRYTLKNFRRVSPKLRLFCFMNSCFHVQQYTCISLTPHDLETKLITGRLVFYLLSQKYLKAY